MKFRIDAEFTHSEIGALINLLTRKVIGLEEGAENKNVDSGVTVDFYALREKLIAGLKCFDDK